MWELESSSGAKWSRHLIVRVPGAAFAHNLAMGAFVQDLMSLPQVRSILPCHACNPLYKSPPMLKM